MRRQQPSRTLLQRLALLSFSLLLFSFFPAPGQSQTRQQLDAIAAAFRAFENPEHRLSDEIQIKALLNLTRWAQLSQFKSAINIHRLVGHVATALKNCFLVMPPSTRIHFYEFILNAAQNDPETAAKFDLPELLQQALTGAVPREYGKGDSRRDLGVVSLVLKAADGFTKQGNATLQQVGAELIKQIHRDGLLVDILDNYDSSQPEWRRAKVIQDQLMAQHTGLSLPNEPAKALTSYEIVGEVYFRSMLFLSRKYQTLSRSNGRGEKNAAPLAALAKEIERLSRAVGTALCTTDGIHEFERFTQRARMESGGEAILAILSLVAQPIGTTKELVAGKASTDNAKKLILKIVNAGTEESSDLDPTNLTEFPYDPEECVKELVNAYGSPDIEPAIELFGHPFSGTEVAGMFKGLAEKDSFLILSKALGIKMETLMELPVRSLAH